MPRLLFYFCYNLLLIIISMILFVLRWFVPKIDAFCKIRSKARSSTIPPKNGQKRLWFHCSSHGELEQVKPVIERLKNENPAIQIHVTFFSYNGYLQGKKYNLLDSYDALPMDFCLRCKMYVEKLDADAVIWVRYDIYPNMLQAIFASKIPICLYSARFDPKQFILSWWAKPLRQVLRKFDKIYVINASSQDALSKTNIPSQIAGDSRKQRVLDIAHHPDAQDAWMQRLQGDRLNLILGSIWPEDWEQFKPNLSRLNKNYRLIVAPHEISADFIKQIKSDLDAFGVHLYTDDITKGDGHIILDTIGRLAIDYRYGQVAYVGGAFKQGLHNILEPMIYGIPVLFGPHFEKYPEALDTISIGATLQISNSTELFEALQSMCNAQLRSEIGKKGKKYIEQMPDATQILLHDLTPIIVPP